MWVFKSKVSGNYVQKRNSFLSASYMFTTNINKAKTFPNVPKALAWLQESVMKNVNDCWLAENTPLRFTTINGVLTLCEVEKYTPPVFEQLREKRVL